MRSVASLRMTRGATNVSRRGDLEAGRFLDRLLLRGFPGGSPLGHGIVGSSDLKHRFPDSVVVDTFGPCARFFSPFPPIVRAPQPVALAHVLAPPGSPSDEFRRRSPVYRSCRNSLPPPKTSTTGQAQPGL